MWTRVAGDEDDFTIWMLDVSIMAFIYYDNDWP